MYIKKIIKVTPEIDAGIRREIDARPNLYRNEQNQISEAELMRRAISFYLASVSDSSINQPAK